MLQEKSPALQRENLAIKYPEKLFYMILYKRSLYRRNSMLQEKSPAMQREHLAIKYYTNFFNGGGVTKYINTSQCLYPHWN
jgi:hypothetical protein